ncbi:MAG: NUDIX domain-containing protein [Bacteroidetes bacterium]|nr:NUDIX domain-containing protein [Bacteroidota bacterium]
MKHFNVRVYGILEENGKVLVSDEHIKGVNITKFPGGGLEFGEGLHQCLVREFKEELDLRVEPVSHFYTTDFFVASAFNTNSQVISIYYRVKALDPLQIKTSDTAFDFPKVKNGAQSFRWIEQARMSENDFTYIIDKRVGEMLAQLR